MPQPQSLNFSDLQAQADVLSPIAPAPSPAEGNTEKQPHLSEYLLDIPRGAFGGVLSFGEDLTTLADDVTDLAGIDLGVDDEQNWRQAAGLSTETAVGDVIHGISNFATGFIPGVGVASKIGKLNQLRKSGVAGRIAFDAIVAAPVDFVVSQQENLSHLIEQYPVLENPVTEFLATTEDTPMLERRFKNALEGMVLGVGVDSLLSSLKVLKATQKGVDGGDVAKALDETGITDDDMLKVLDPQTAPAQRATRTIVLEEKVTLPSPAKLSEDEHKQVEEAMEMIYTGHPDTDRSLEALKSTFNLGRMVSDHDSFKTLNALTDVLTDKMDKMRGGAKQTFEGWKQQASLVDEMDEIAGIPGDVRSRLRAMGEMSNEMAATMVAGRMMASTMSERITQLSKLKVAGEAGVKHDAELLKLTHELASLLVDLKAAGTGAARATASGRINMDIRLPVKELEDLLERSGGDKQVRKLAEFMQLADGDMRKVSKRAKDAFDTKTGKLINLHNEVWINSILSGPVTHTVNMLSNAVYGLALPAEQIVGGALGGDLKTMQHGMDQVVGLFMGLKDSVKFSAMAAKLGDGILDPTSGTVDLMDRHAVEAMVPSEAPNFMKHAASWLGNTVRLPSRFLGAEDELFKQLNYRSYSYAQAISEARASGLSGVDAIRAAVKKMDEAVTPEGAAREIDSLDYARLATFTNPLEYGIGNSIQGMVARHPALRVVLPFIRTPTNILRQTVRHMPGVQLLQKQFREDLASGDPVRVARARGQVAMGATLTGAAAMAAASGRITGGGPSDHNQREALRNTGWQPYSIVSFDENGKKTYTSYQRMEPWATILGLVADTADVVGQADEGDIAELTMGLTVATAKNITSKTYLKGLSEAVDVLTDPDRNVKRWARKQAGSYVPNFFNQINDDPHLRETRSVLEGIKARIPGYSETLDPRRNILGETMNLAPGVGPDYLSPFFQSQQISSAGREELTKLGKGFTKPRPEMFGVDLSQERAAKSKYTAYDRWMELVGTVKDGKGRTISQALDDLVQSKGYQALPQADELPEDARSGRADAVRSVLMNFRQAARKRLFKEQPELLEKVRESAKQLRLASRPQ